MNATRRNLKIAVCCLVLIQATWVLGQAGSRVAETRHNLSSTGPGPIKVIGERDVCKFCHTPHASNPIAPLWNRADSGTYYQTYESSTLVSTVGQPTGSSRLCLSCHDGTIALTQTYNPRNAPQGSIYISSQDSGYIGTNLSDDHPISFKYDMGLVAVKQELRNPESLPSQLPLDRRGELQCTTCHDPHNDSFGKFLRMNNDRSALCQSCHAMKEWNFSSHATSSSSLAVASRDTWDNINAATVADAACEACHRPHNAGGRQRLLRHEAEEDNCLSCHDGSVAIDIATDARGISNHPVSMTTGVHDLAENASSMSEHVECVDCHDPHQATSGGRSVPPYIKPSMKGATGYAESGLDANEALYEYQVCYKCHAGRGALTVPVVQRVLVNTNVAEEFSPINPSFHPIEVRGKSLNVPSLLEPYDETYLIYCSDCHGSASGTAKGPHGSIYRPILKRQYVTVDNTTESPAAYALCYGCHNRTSILNDDSFSLHKKHIENEDTPCSACHDAHGVSATQSNGSGTHLINFDRIIVRPSSKAGTGPSFTDGGIRSGSCTLLCHGEDHNPAKYGPGGEVE